MKPQWMKLGMLGSAQGTIGCWWDSQNGVRAEASRCAGVGLAVLSDAWPWLTAAPELGPCWGV